MRVLLVTAEAEAAPRQGGYQRTLLLHRALKKIGTVDLALLRSRDDQLSEPPAQVEAHYHPVHWCGRTAHEEDGAWRFLGALAPILTNRLARNLGSRALQYRPDPISARRIKRLIEKNRYDVIVCRYLKNAALAGLLAETQPCPVALDLDDHDLGAAASRATDPGAPCWRRLLSMWRLLRLRRVVPVMLSRCDMVWVSNINDRTDPALSSAVHLPNIPFNHDDPEQLPSPLPPANHSHRLLIVGTGSWLPNIQGISHFLDRIWPRIRSQRSDAELHIYGHRIKPKERQRWSTSPGVTVHGFIEDIKDAYRHTSFSIAPMYSGGGTHIKVIESLALGRACVLTPVSWRGYETSLPAGTAVLVGRDDEAFAAECVRLIQNPALRDQLAAAGHAIAAQHYVFSNFARAVSEIAHVKKVSGSGAPKQAMTAGSS